MSGYPKFKRKNRALNLACNDAVKKCKVMRDAMDTAYEAVCFGKKVTQKASDLDIDDFRHQRFLAALT